MSLLTSAPGAVIWSIGADDNTQDGEGDLALNDPATLNGVPFNVSGVQENGEQPLPGNPANVGGANGDPGRDIDDDYYFAGVYSIVTDGGAYTPVGEVPVSESYYDRAFTGGDPNMRWHFNIPETVVETDVFTFTIDFYSLNEANPTDNSSFDMTFWVNGTQVGEMQSHNDFDLDAVQTWDFTVEDLGGVDQVGPGFDHYVEVRSSTTGSARWANLDYVQLEVNSEPPPADDPNLPVPASLNFGDVEIGSEDVPQSLELSNTGASQNLTITQMTITGANADAFRFVPPALPLVLGPGESTSIEITLTPGDVAGPLTAALEISSNDSSDGLQDIVLLANTFRPFGGDGVLWSLGTDDGAQDGEGDAALNDPAFFNGLLFSVSGVRESGQNDLPGNPANTGGASGDVNRDIDDDYYFAGVYDTVTDGGFYTPVGDVPENESYYDRAVTNGDPNMRWHFNVPESLGANDVFTFSIDFYNLDEEFPENDSSYDITFWVDGRQIGEMQSHSDADLNAVQSWEFSLDDLGGAAQQGSGFDHYVEVRTQSTGSARWASLDYVELAVVPGDSGELIISDFTVDSETNNVTLQFKANVGQTYIIERSTKMLPSGQPGGWLEIEDSLEANEEIVTFTDPGAASDNPALFYRVRRGE
jgi:hypothetical protein